MNIYVRIALHSTVQKFAQLDKEITLLYTKPTGGSKASIIQTDSELEVDNNMEKGS